MFVFDDVEVKGCPSANCSISIGAEAASSEHNQVTFLTTGTA
jgi:hypothetical protein